MNVCMYVCMNVCMYVGVDYPLVCNNAAWTLGELAMQAGGDFLQPYLPHFMQGNTYTYIHLYMHTQNESISFYSK